MKAYVLWCDGTVEEKPELSGPITKVFDAIAMTIAKEEKDEQYAHPARATIQALRLRSFGAAEIWVDENGHPNKRWPNKVASSFTYPAWGQEVIGTAVLRLPRGRELQHDGAIGVRQDIWRIVKTSGPRKGTSSWADHHPAVDKLMELLREVYQEIAPDLIAADASTAQIVECILDKAYDKRNADKQVLTPDERARGVSIGRTPLAHLMDDAPRSWLEARAKEVI